MNKKVILILRSNPVDPDSRVEKEANSLSKYGYEVKILAWDRCSRHKTIKSKLNLNDSEVEILRFGIPASYGEGFKNIIPYMEFQIKIFSWIVTNRKLFDSIHACDFDTALTTFIASKCINKVFVFDIFDFLYSNPTGKFISMKNLIVKIQKFIINHSNGTIICTEKRIEQISGSIPKKLAIIHNTPPQINQFNAIALSEKIKIVYVGILQDFRLLKEMAEIIINRSNCELHIGGFGKYDDYFRELSKKYANIIYYGKLSYNETLNLEKSCDIMTAIYDPNIDNHIYAAPNKFYEALMIGKPLIMVRGTGMSDIVEKYCIGEVIDYNMNSLSLAIDKLVERKSNWNTISSKMQALYNQDYSWEKMENKLIKFYDDIFN